MFTGSESESRREWDHGTVDHAVRLAKAAEVWLLIHDRSRLTRSASGSNRLGRSDLEDIDRRLSAAERHRTEQPDRIISIETVTSRLRDDDLVGLCDGFEAGCRIHDIAKHRVFAAPQRADVANARQPGMNANPDSQGWPRGLLVQKGERPMHYLRRTH